MLKKLIYKNKWGGSVVIIHMKKNVCFSTQELNTSPKVPNL